MSEITVDELLKKPFCDRTQEEKINILSEPKPRPTFPVFLRDSRNILIEGEFKKSMYNKINWLTASEKRKEFFCWPCLLFWPPNTWNSGISDLDYVMTYHEQHGNDPKHLEATSNLISFITSNFENPEEVLHPESIELYSISDLDRRVFTYLIDAICFEVRNAPVTTKNMKMRIGVHFTEIIDKMKEDPEIINGLVDAITIILKAAIESEIKQSTYAAVILSEHILYKEESQISTVLRYLKNGDICERFVGFTNSVGSRMQHNDIADLFLKVKKFFHIRGKVQAISIDGAVLPYPELSKLFELENFQHNYFIPSYFHQFGCILIQSVTHLKECEIFFRSVRGIESYFANENNSFRLKSLLVGEVPCLKRKKWHSKVPFIVYLSLYRQYIVLFFRQEVLYSAYVSPENKANAKTFEAFLENFKTIFLLKVFANIFKQHFDKNLNFRANLFAKNFTKKFAKFQSNMDKLQVDGFAILWNEAISAKQVEAESREVAFESPEKTSYIKLFEIILNEISKRVKLHLKDIASLAFCGLLNCNNVGELDFKEKLVKLLLRELKTCLDETTLRNEIALLKSEALEKFQNKSIYDIIATIKEDDLFKAYSQVYKLGEFILTMPFLPPSKDIDYMKTKLKQIEKFSYIPEATGIPSGDASVLCVEQEFLQKLRTTEGFYDDVIKKYYQMKDEDKFHQD